MLILYSKLVQHQTSCIPIKIITQSSNSNNVIIDGVEKHQGRTLSEDINSHVVEFDLGVTIALKGKSINELSRLDINLNSDETTSAADDDTLAESFYLPELNRDIVMDIPTVEKEVDVLDSTTNLLTKVKKVQKRKAFVYFPTVILEVTFSKNRTRYDSPNSRYVQQVTLKVSVTQNTVSEDINTKYLNFIFSPNSVISTYTRDSKLYSSIPSILPIGVMTAILGSSASGKSRLISDILSTKRINITENTKIVNKDECMESRCETPESIEKEGRMQDILLVCDEPSMHPFLWYTHGDMNSVIYGLTQRILQCMLRFYCVRYLNDKGITERPDKTHYLNFFIDSITDLLYGYRKSETLGEDRVASVTFTKGVTAATKPEMLFLSRTAGYIEEWNLMITLCVTGNIPGTGEESDEKPFWNMVSGNSVNSIWLLGGNVHQVRNRVIDFMVGGEGGKKRGMYKPLKRDGTGLTDDEKRKLFG